MNAAFFRTPRRPRAASTEIVDVIDVIDVIEIVDARGRGRYGACTAPADAARRTASATARCGWFADSSLDLLTGLDVTFDDGVHGRDALIPARPVAAWLPFVAPGDGSSQSARGR